VLTPKARNMPQPPSMQKRYPGKNHLLKHAAEWGQLVVVRCNLCRRGVTYLATDLVALLDPDRLALLPPFPCSRCGTTEFTRVTLTAPFSGDWGNLEIRRPGPLRITQTWRTVRLGDP
jgi:predicted RNA-binding Zn-ribbon protein involved in translation (DUF1610 family)